MGGQGGFFHGDIFLKMLLGFSNELRNLHFLEKYSDQNSAVICVLQFPNFCHVVVGSEIKYKGAHIKER